MAERTPLAEAAARILRQRRELGLGDVVLDGLTRADAMRLARAGREAGAPGGGGSTPPSGPSADSPARTVGTTAPSARADSAEKLSLASLVKAEMEASEAREQARSDVEGAAGDPALPDDYDALKELALGCTKCRLAETRNQVVFSDGARDARLMVVGEAPGANEDATGLPFVGQAGRFLDLLLACVDLSRKDSVYIANVLKCRPPGNRNPQADEIECCSPYLRKQIDLVAPQAILAVGTFAGQLLTGEKKSLGRLRGEVHSYHGVPLLVTYHPAALLRNSRWTRPVWDDLQLLRDVMAAG